MICQTQTQKRSHRSLCPKAGTLAGNLPGRSTSESPGTRGHAPSLGPRPRPTTLGRDNAPKKNQWHYDTFFTLAQKPYLIPTQSERVQFVDVDGREGAQHCAAPTVRQQLLLLLTFDKGQGEAENQQSQPHFGTWDVSVQRMLSFRTGVYVILDASPPLLRSDSCFARSLPAIPGRFSSSLFTYGFGKCMGDLKNDIGAKCPEIFTPLLSKHME